MSFGTLYTVDRQPKGKIIRATAALAGHTLDIPTDYVHFESNKKPEFLAKFPHGKIPSLETKDGFKLFEGIPIARYIASQSGNANLLGKTPEDAALIDQWVHLAEAEVDVATDIVFYLTNGVMPVYNKPTHTWALERQQRALNTFEKHLTENTFLVGERITLADVAFAGFIFRAAAVTLDAQTRPKYPAVIRHLETIVNQPKVKEIFGEITYTEKGAQYTPPAKEKKEPKPAAAPQPKAEKKPKKADDDDDDEPAVPAEPKVKNPLDDLPKSTFNLEDWKRAYSNKDTRGPDGAIEWFYQNFDKEGFTIWRVDFKYNNELTQTFMSSNQITGFFNRLEASRKYLFGSVGVLGKANDSIISGVFIGRGKDIKLVVDCAPDWESYEYKEIDLSDAAQKEFFEGALAWDLKVGDKEWVDGKNFK